MTDRIGLDNTYSNPILYLSVPCYFDKLCVFVNCSIFAGKRFHYQ